MEDASKWFELVQTFGLPTVLLGVVGYILYETQKFVRGKLMELVERVTSTVASNTETVKANTDALNRVHGALDKRQPGTL